TSTASGVGVGLTWGVLRGMGHGFVRTVGGLYEVVTFLFPAPPDYQPIMRPRYVFTCEDADSRPGGYSGSQ
ncbi:MAG: exosortase system-associated protein, TIGR04073 family, partial [Candidatus Omnitrophica bacterium]|nr:exosortase system-associated protein, TIGR04073 family [Candidatus Omnitrophota bacterium]